MRHWRSPNAAAALISGLLLLSGLGAAQQTLPPPDSSAPSGAPDAPVPTAPLSQAVLATSPAICTLDDQLLSVRVGGQLRGDALVKISGVQFFVESRIVQPSERQYVVSATDCDEGRFLELDPRLRPRFDPLEQSLSLQPVLALLTSNTLDFRQDQQIAPTATQPSLGLDFGIRANTSLMNAGQTYSVLGYLGIGYAAGPIAIYGGGIASSSPDNAGVTSFSAAPRATFRYSLSPRLALTAAYNAPPDQLSARSDLQRFQGVRLDARSDDQLFFPEIDLVLLLDADIQVNINGQQLRAFRASAGALKLVNIPFQGFGATVDVIINDGTSPRIRNFSYLADARSVRPGAYIVGAQAGLLGGERNLSGQLVFGVGRHWTLNGRADLLADDYTADTSLEYADDLNTLGAGVSLGGPTQSAVNARLSLRYRRAVNDRLSVNVATTLPVTQPERFNLQAGAAYRTERWSYQLSGNYDFGVGALGFDANASYSLNSGQIISFGISKNQQNWRASLSTDLFSWPKLQVGLNAVTSTLPTVQVVPTLKVRYQPSPEHTLNATLNTSAAAASYLYDGRVRASLSAASLLGTLNGASVTGVIDGAVSLVNGQFSLSQGLGTRTILVKTGVAGVPLMINGVTVGVTDARGDALITRLPATEYVTLLIDVDALPFNISVQNDRSTLRLPANGTAVLDWRGNILVSRYLQLFFAPGQPASYGNVRIGELVYPLDDAGNGLIGSVPDGTTATLKSDDGSRSCAVILSQSQATSTCASP